MAQMMAQLGDETAPGLSRYIAYEIVTCRLTVEIIGGPFECHPCSQSQARPQKFYETSGLAAIPTRALRTSEPAPFLLAL